jgi:predicted DNA binding CopG/RHH family protein
MKKYNTIKPLDKEEKELIESIKNDEWKPVKNMDEFKIQAQKYAESTIKKDKRMNIRISERDKYGDLTHQWTRPREFT